MNLRGNKTLMAGGIICALILGIQLILLVLTGVRLSASARKWEHAKSELNRLLNRNPYPSAENVKIAEENLDALDYHTGELIGELNRSPFPVHTVEAAEFSALTQDIIERFRNKAAQAKVTLPQTLEAGFARYASGGAIPDVADVPRLTRQLYSAERVANLLVERGVTTIDGMSRDAFDLGEPEGARLRRKHPGAGKRRPGGVNSSGIGKENLYSIERIEVDFTATEEVVWRVLEGFLSDPHFMTISEFGHHTASAIMDYSPAAVKRGRDTDDETLKFLAEGILTGEGALSRPERIIAGNELVHVRLAVDVYNFNPEDHRK